MRADAIQSKIWKGYGRTAEHLGQECNFYRLPGVQAPAKRYDTGLVYGHAGKYDFDPSLLRATAYDKPGQRWDLSGYFDQVPPDEAAETQFDIENQTFDAGQDWDQPGRFMFQRRVSVNAEDMTYKRPNKYGKATWYALFDGQGVTVGDYFIGPVGVFFIAAMQPMLPILAVSCNRVISILRLQAHSSVGLGGYGGSTENSLTTLLKGRPASVLQGTKGERNEAALPGDTRTPWWTILLPGAGGQIKPNDVIEDELGNRYTVSSPELTDLGWRLTAMMAVT